MSSHAHFPGSHPSPSALFHLGFGNLRTGNEKGGRSCAQAQTTECAGAVHSAVLRATWRAGVRKPQGEAVLTATLSIFLLRGATADTMLKKFDKKDEESGGGSNPLQHLEKSAVLQEASATMPVSGQEYLPALLSDTNIHGVLVYKAWVQEDGTLFIVFASVASIRAAQGKTSGMVSR